MTKKTDNSSPRKHDDEASKLELHPSENPSSKPRKKAIRRIVLIEDAVDSDLNSLKKEHLDLLYQIFSLRVETIAVLQLPKIPDPIKTDFLLSKYAHDFETMHREVLPLIQKIKARWESCNRYQDYHELTKLLFETIDSLSELQINLETLHKEIVQRLELLSFQHVEPHHIKDAQSKLMSSLDAVILSLLVLEFNPSIYAQADFFKKQTITILEEVKDLMKNSNLHFDSDVVDGLITHLFAHVGLKKHIFGINSNIPAQPICLKIINPLVHQLFEEKVNKPPQEIGKRVLAFYDLAARLEASPLHIIKKYELVHYCKRSQEEQITKLNNELTQLLNRLVSQLIQMKTLFAGSDYESLLELRTSNTLIAEIEALFEELKVYNPHPLKEEAKLSELLEFTKTQEEWIEKLAHIEHKAISLSNKTQTCVNSLIEYYSQERHFLIRELKDAIKQVQALLDLPTKSQYSQDIDQANSLVKDLLTSDLNIPLNSLKTKAQYKTLKLKGYINAFKITLKMDWARNIFDILGQKSESIPFRRDTPSSIILWQLNQYNKPYKTLQLSANNPFQTTLDEITEECNQSLKHLIHHFSKLEHTSGEDLNAWFIRIQNLHHKSQEYLERRNTIQKHAQILEHRIHNPAYLTSLEVINSINKELLALIQYYSKSLIIKNPNNELGMNFLKSPSLFLQKNNLEAKEIKLLDQLNPQIVRLFTLSKELSQLNNVFISEHLNLCCDHKYINQLLNIIIVHIEKDGKELYAQGFGDANRFIEWLHTKAYTPLLKFYVPHSPNSESVDVSLDSGIYPFKQRASSVFFQNSKSSDSKDISMEASASNTK